MCKLLFGVCLPSLLPATKLRRPIPIPPHRHPQNDLDMTRLESLLLGYCQSRSLTPTELEKFVPFMRCAVNPKSKI